MPNYKVQGNTVLRIDASAGGTLNSITTYVDRITPGFGRAYQVLDTTHFDDAAERVIAGIEQSQEFSLTGAFDDTATTGPDAIFGTAVGTALTFEFNPIGTVAGNRKFTGEVLVVAYLPSGEVKGRVNYEVRLKLDGTIVVGTN